MRQRVALASKGRTDAVAVAVGTSGGQRLQWQLPIAQARPTLVALDDEPENAGVQRAVLEWLHVCKPHALRWAPTAKDCGAMLQVGQDVRAWVDEGLYAVRASQFAEVCSVEGY